MQCASSVDEVQALTCCDAEALHSALCDDLDGNCCALAVHCRFHLTKAHSERSEIGALLILLHWVIC